MIKYIDSILKSYHNSDRYLYKQLFDVGQREVFFGFFNVSY